MHGDATQLAAFGLASFAVVAALIPLVSDFSPSHEVVAPEEERPGGFAAGLLVLELATACVLFALGVRVHLVNQFVDLVLTAAWLVLIGHSFSILDDNIEGAAGVVASATAIAVAVVAALRGQLLVGDIAAILAGSSAAVLLYNWHPAPLRLTSSASVAVGFVLGSLLLQLDFRVSSSDSWAAFSLLAAAPVVFAGVILADRWLHRAGLATPPGTTLHPTLVAAVVGPAAVVLAATGVAIGRAALPSWVAVPAGLSGTAL